MTFPQYPLRYPGPRWKLVYGSSEGIEKTALEELYRQAQAFLPYVLSLAPVASVTQEDLADHAILIGTVEDNPFITQASKDHPLPAEPEGYAIGCVQSPWNPGRKVIILSGSDPAGVLHAVTDFAARILASQARPEKPTPERLRQAFDSLGEFWICETPRVQNRGIWTWGYVIYDYRRFIDHMARLKMNMLTAWNDCPPVNAAEVIEYAHSRGVKINFGFPWGWGMDLDLVKEADRQKIKEMVLGHYRQYYAGLKMDGIYFQTLTEHNQLQLGGRSVAEIVCGMVNEVSRALLELNSELRIYFGLHATSILDRYVDLESLDKRVTIVWEDAGVLPYSYIPMIERTPQPNTSLHLDDFESTLQYSKKIASFRPGTEFALVPKGWSNLDWGTEFEHHGSYLLGMRQPGYVRERMRQRQPYWDRINALWMKYYPYQARFYREMLALGLPSITATGLLEDGIFEEKIQPSVALLAETLWNPMREDEGLLELALSPYYYED